MDVSSFRFAGATYAIRLTADPDDTRILQISTGADGGADVALIQHEGRADSPAVRLTCARDIYNLLDTHLRSDRHPLDGIDTVEQEARRMVAARNGLGRSDTPEALAAWNSLSAIEKTREKAQARTRLDIASITSLASANLIDPSGATLETGLRLKFKAIALLAKLMDNDMARAHETWLKLMKSQRSALVDKAREALAAEAIEDRAAALYEAENGSVSNIWNTANENEKNSYRSIARDDLAEKGVIDADGKLVFEGEPPL